MALIPNKKYEKPLKCCWQLLFKDLIVKLLKKLQKQMDHTT